MQKKENVREIVLEILIQTMEKGQYCDKALHEQLKKQEGLEKRDRAFITRLSEGTVEQCIRMDRIINQYSKTPVRKMKPVIRNILRMSVYQIFEMEQVPDSAVCNEAVKLAVKRKFSTLRGFVNGVLRTICREKDVIIKKGQTKYSGDLSYQYSLPEWLVHRLTKQYGKEITAHMGQWFVSGTDDTTVRCNLSKISVEELEKSLASENVTFEKGVLFPYALHLQQYDTLSKLSAFQKGYFQVQDESSMLVGAVSGISEGNTVIDVCAAPGGKTLHAADLLRGTGQVISCDLTKNKVELIRENAVRNGFNHIAIYCHDAKEHNTKWHEKADVVIADLPCSGLGVIGKKSDIKYKTKEEDIDALSQIQKDILKTVSNYVKPGGTLIYSTCTIVREENEDNVDWILKNLPFVSVSIENELPEALRRKTGAQGYVQVLPGEVRTDGFFVAKFQKKE